jgi:hypothetical protein
VLEASWVEDPVAPTRATENLQTGARVRIIARKSTDASAITEKDYTVNGSGTIVPLSGDPMVLADGTYDFTAYSYNSSTATLPTTTDDDLVVTFNPYVGDAATDIGNDLLLSTTPSESPITKIGSSGITLNTFKHQFSRVKYSVVFTPTVPATYNISVKLSTNYKAQLTKSSDAFAPSGLPTEQTLDKDNYHIVYAGDSPPKLKISGTITTTSPDKTTNFTDLPVPYKKNLAAGKSYTLQITITNRLTWAG